MLCIRYFLCCTNLELQEGSGIANGGAEFPSWQQNIGQKSGKIWKKEGIDIGKKGKIRKKKRGKSDKL